MKGLEVDGEKVIIMRALQWVYEARGRDKN